MTTPRTRDTQARKRDYMALTPAERKTVVGSIVKSLESALAAANGEEACHHLEWAQDALQRITRRQWWSTR